jgi:hypothetical protein
LDLGKREGDWIFRKYKPFIELNLITGMGYLYLLTFERKEVGVSLRRNYLGWCLL